MLLKKGTLTLLAALTIPSISDAGGFEVESGDYSLRIGGLMQNRFVFEQTGDEQEAYFYVPRAQLALRGSTAGDISWKMQTEFGNDSAKLKDFFIDLGFAGNNLRIGQYKLPFSRQQLTSDSQLEFVGRAATDKEFGAGRDIGLQYYNHLRGNEGFEWAVGIFNGDGYNASSSEADLFTPRVVVRASYNNTDFDAYKEGDRAGGDLRYSVALGAIADISTSDPVGQTIVGNLDFLAKTNGFCLSGSLYMDDLTGELMQHWGGHVQAGYMLTDTWEPSLRYVMIEGREIEQDGGSPLYVNHTEVGLAMTAYASNSGFKWLNDISWIDEGQGDDPSYVLRSQAQLSF